MRVGDIAEVELENGVAEVTMDIDRKFLPIYSDATALLRPRTGLQDMFLELDPGTKPAGEFEEGDTIPARQHRARRSTSTRSSRRSTATPRPTCGCCSSAAARG